MMGSLSIPIDSFSSECLAMEIFEPLFESCEIQQMVQVDTGFESPVSLPTLVILGSESRGS